MPLIDLRKPVLFFTVLLNHFIIPKRPHCSKNITRLSSTVSSQNDHFQKFHNLARRQDLKDNVAIFNVEAALLKSSSLFPYFMLVAFEAGSLIRALVLFTAYPFLICFCSKDSALRAMVMICFFGLKKDSFREGRSVLPKFFLEDVAMESFEVLRRAKTTVAITDLPLVMVESFLKDYLEIDHVVARDLKVFSGHFLGTTEGRTKKIPEIITCNNNSAIGIISSFQDYASHSQWFSNCKEIYIVSEQERRNWNKLQRNSYPKPLIFHDGRLAFRPTYSASLAMFVWLPFGLCLCMIRIVVASSLPIKIMGPILHFIGLQVKVSKAHTLENCNHKGTKGNLYVCNHKTLLDPIFVSYAFEINPITAATYSLSRLSEIFSLIKTVRLKRNREHDAELMQEVLRQRNLIVCPEGTTCREPYLLRFSPLFTGVCERIFPVAVDCHVSMFYGTTASGFKCLDPIFFLMNPKASYSVRLLDVVQGVTSDSDDGDLKIKAANRVQNEIGKALGFECTNLTRKHKYSILAGNEGIVGDGKK